MVDVHVSCINKQPRQNPYEGITHLGGPGGGGWRWTREQVIASIERKENAFYTLVEGNRGDVGIVNGPSGKYLRTYRDGMWNDNLLSLPECPA